MDKRPVLSICIPTFNRGERVFYLVSSILKYKNDNIEVLVLDNCSNDNTIELLSRITDKRFRLIINENNIGGIKNPVLALTYAIGEYCMLCLDKDYIDFNYIDELIKRLKIDSKVESGFCALNLEKTSDDTLYNAGFQSIFNTAYLSKHPSGKFYKTELFKKAKFIKSVFEDNKKFGFYFELATAEFALYGKTKIINLPIIITEPREFWASTLSFTYTSNDAFFLPKNRMKEFEIYCKHLLSLKIEINDKMKILKKLYLSSLIASTFGFRSIIRDIDLRKHYHLKMESVSLIKLFKYYFEFSFTFFKSDISISLFDKLIIFLTSNKSLINLMFKK